MSIPIQNNGNDLSTIIEALNNIPEKKYTKGTFHTDSSGWAEINLGWKPDIVTLEFGAVYMDDGTTLHIQHTLNFMHNMVYPQGWSSQAGLDTGYTIISGIGGLSENGVQLSIQTLDDAYNTLDPSTFTFHYTAFKFL